MNGKNVENKPVRIGAVNDFRTNGVEKNGFWIITCPRVVVDESVRKTGQVRQLRTGSGNEMKRTLTGQVRLTECSAPKADRTASPQSYQFSFFSIFTRNGNCYLVVVIVPIIFRFHVRFETVIGRLNGAWKPFCLCRTCRDSRATHFVWAVRFYIFRFTVFFHLHWTRWPTGVVWRVTVSTVFYIIMLIILCVSCFRSIRTGQYRVFLTFDWKAFQIGCDRYYNNIIVILISDNNNL